MAAATGSRWYRLRASVVPSLAALSSRALDPFVSFAVPVSHDHKEPGFLSPELTRPACTSSRLDSSFCVTDHLRYGGALGACELDAWHLGLGSSYGVRGFAKAKKIKARKLWLTLILFTAWLMSASAPLRPLARPLSFHVWLFVESLFFLYVCRQENKDNPSQN